MHFVCSRIDYRYSFPIVSPTQLVLDAAGRFIARLHKFSYMSSFTANQFHRLPLSARIQFIMYVLILKSKLGVAPNISGIIYSLPLSAVSHLPLSFLSKGGELE